MDISYIKPHIQNVNLVIDKIKYICEQLASIDNSECRNVLQPFTVRFRDIIKEYSSITHLIDSRVKRSAWIGGIGTAMKQIFGTLDEDDAIKYDTAINHVQNNQKRLASLMKEHILVTTSALARYNDTLNKIKVNEANLNIAINKLSTELRNITKTTNNLLINSEINSIFTILESSLLTLSFQVEDLTSSILFSSVNVLHPSVITPRQLYTELADNYRHLPNNFELAVELNIDLIHVILSTSKLISYYINDKVMFVLQIPLVNPRQFYIYNNVPLPIPHNAIRPDSFSVIVPSHKYVMITKDKLHYSTLDSLEKCKNTNSQNYVCEIVKVLPTSENPSCESELLSKVITKIPTQCKTEFIRGNLDIWKPLQNNKWIFIQTTLSKLSIDCLNSELTEINVIGIGIVEIPTNCKAFSRDTELLPNYNIMNVSLPVIKLDFNLINDSCCSLTKFVKIADKIPIINLKDLDLKNIDFVKTVNSKIVSELDKIIQEPHIVKYGAHYSSLTLFVILITVVILFYTFYHKKVFTNKSGNNHEDEQLELSIINPKNKTKDIHTDTEPVTIEVEESFPKTRRNL